MRIRSFRIRIAMWSVLCSSFVLLGSSLVARNALWRSEIRRVDSFLGSDVQRRLDFGHGDDPDPDQPDRPFPDERPPQGPIAFDGMERQHPAPWLRPPMPRPQRIQTGVQEASAPTIAYLFRDLTNGQLVRSGNWPAAIAESTLVANRDATARFRTVAANGALWRIAAGGSDERTVAVAVDLAPAILVVKGAVGAFLLSTPVALVLIAIGALFLAQRALRPVRDLTQLVERITARGLGERVDAPVRDAEFEELIRVFNEMMDRLERSFAQANRFSADAAHELRTPLTVLQGHVERMLQATEPGSPMQQDLGDMLEEMHRIKSILERLLLLAQMDAGQVQIGKSPLDLGELVESVVEDIRALAPDDLAVEVSIAPDVRVDADAALLETAIQNLASNAVKYNRPEAGRVVVELTATPHEARLAVSNTGPKIPPEDRARIFQRFYRGDKSRSREVDGTGLGLSLAREIVQAHQGHLELVETRDDLNRFEIVLPLRAAQRPGSPLPATPAASRPAQPGRSPAGE